jgi:exopolyphosphatase/guanosine-5'-triphosphate,3'-diphosphate pyrophosphatase
MDDKPVSNLAAIDVGSNAIRMLVSRLNTGGSLETLENLRLPVRLGQDAFASGVFSEQTMQMAVDAFRRFRQVADLFEVSQARAVATSAMREAANSDLLVDRVARETGFAIELISGEEEARLIHLAVKHSVDLTGKIALLVDIGGGSVEVTLSDGENILSTESFGMGTVRLLNRLNPGNGLKIPLSSLLREYAASAHRYIDREIGDNKIQLFLGTGGNIEEMGRLRRRLFDKRRSDLVTLDELTRLIEIIGDLSVQERMQQLDLNPDRADVILPAMIVLQMIAQEAHAWEVLIPGVGLKDGVLLELAPLALGPYIPRRTQVIASVERMGQKYAYDAEHAAVTARLAVRLFDQSLSLHHLTENERLLLEAAAMLHDIGHFINTIDHDRHGCYLLRHHTLIGLTPAEQEIVANLVYYHRKQAPAPGDENIKSLAQKDRITITKLTALLRLADALDVSHLARVQDLVLEQQSPDQWSLYLVSQGEALLEKWSLGKRNALFQDVFGVKLDII